MPLAPDVIDILKEMDKDIKTFSNLLDARMGMLGDLDPLDRSGQTVNFFWGPAAPQAFAKSRTRKMPRIAWDYSEFDAALRRRILDLEYPGQDTIDPDKPYEVEVGETHVTIKQDAS